MIERLAEDVRYSCRLICKSPGTSAFVIVLLTLGIGLNASVFCLVNAVLVRPLPVRNPEELVRFVQVLPNLGSRSTYTYRPYKILKQETTSLSDVIAYTMFSTAEGEDSGMVNRIWCEAVSGNYFTGLGVQAIHGRLFTEADDSLAEDIVVLSYSYWQRRFHADRGVVGRKLHLQGRIFTIVGITPREFNGLQIDTSPDVRVLIRAADLLLHQPELNSQKNLILYDVVARQRPGVTLEQSRVEAEQLFRSAIEEDSTDPDLREQLRREQFEALPVNKGLSVLREKYSNVLLLLMGGVTVLLLMICANVGGLLLVRATRKRHETAVRLALGASTSRILRIPVIESLLLTITGGLGGLGLACASASYFDRMLPILRNRDTTPLTLSVNWMPDTRVIAFTLALCVICALLAGFPAGFQALRSDVFSAMRATRASLRDRLRWVLVAIQAALGTMLLAVTGLLVLTLHNLQSLDPGFDQQQVVTFTADTGMLHYTKAQSWDLETRLVEAVKALPGVESAALARIGVMRGTGMKTTVAPEGQKVASSDNLNTSINFVSADYFDSMGIAALAGRKFRADEPQQKPEPVMVNRAFVQRFFPGSDPLGRRFGYAFDKPASADMEIIGVVGDAKYRSLREPVPPTVYELLDPARSGAFVMHVRTRILAEGLIEPVRRALHQLEPRLPFSEIRTLSAEVDASLWPERMLSRLSILFSIFAGGIATLGVYGTLVFAVLERKREIGVRVALGASAAQIVRICGERPLSFVGFGAAIGVAALYLIGPTLWGLVYGVSPRDPYIGGAAMLTMVILATSSSVTAAMTALRIDPAQVLREE